MKSIPYGGGPYRIGESILAIRLGGGVGVPSLVNNRASEGVVSAAKIPDRFVDYFIGLLFGKWRHRKTDTEMELQCQKLLRTICFGKHGTPLLSKSSPCSELLVLSNLHPEAQGSSGQAYHQSIAATPTGTIATKAQL